MSIEAEQIDQLLETLRRDCLPAGGADLISAYVSNQRRALFSVQAELPDLRANMTKALDLLQVLTSTKYTDRAFVEAVDDADEMLAQLRGKVVLKGQAEQQEAQGAQAGDDVIKLFERIIRQSPADLDRATEDNPWYQVMASEVREFAAALATQPAAGEPVYQWREDQNQRWWTTSKADYEWILENRPNCQVRILWTAPPAAALGDEAPGTVRVTADWLKKVHRDFDACQKVIWLAGCRPRVPGGFDPAYCEDAQARLKEIDVQIARAHGAGKGQ